MNERFGDLAVDPKILNQYLREIINCKYRDDSRELPDPLLLVSMVESIVRNIALKSSSRIPRVVVDTEESLKTKVELDDLFSFAHQVTTTGKQVITGDILEFLYGVGVPTIEGYLPKKVPMPAYVAKLAGTADGGLFGEKAEEIELLAFRSLKRNAAAVAKWTNTPSWVRPLGFRVDDLPKVLKQWEKEIIQIHEIDPVLL